jgi:hypothetical protein
MDLVHAAGHRFEGQTPRVASSISAGVKRFSFERVATSCSGEMHGRRQDSALRVVRREPIVSTGTDPTTSMVRVVA